MLWKYKKRHFETSRVFWCEIKKHAISILIFSTNNELIRVKLVTLSFYLIIIRNHHWICPCSNEDIHKYRIWLSLTSSKVYYSQAWLYSTRLDEIILHLEQRLDTTLHERCMASWKKNSLNTWYMENQVVLNARSWLSLMKSFFIAKRRSLMHLREWGEDYEE